MEETEVIAWAMSSVATVAIVVIAFNVVSIRRMLAARTERTDGRPAARS
jgi:hypothetical protein